MQVQSVNNQYNNPNFGIKYVRPRHFPSDVLDALMQSELVKQIDEKYPKARVKYSEFRSYIFNLDHYYLKFKLDKKIKSEMLNNKSHLGLIDDIKSTGLDDLKNNSNIAKAKAKKIEKQKANVIYNAAIESNKTSSKEKRQGIIGWLRKLFN